MNSDKVRHDLEELRHKRQYIRVQIDRQNEADAQLRELMRRGDAEAVKVKQEYIEKLDIKERIAEADELEFRYQEAIAHLDPTEQIIINSNYLIGTPHFIIANRLGYSVEGIKYKKRQAIEKIAEYLERVE